MCAHIHTPQPTSQFLNKYNTHNHNKQIGQSPRAMFRAGRDTEGQDTAAKGTALAQTVAALRSMKPSWDPKPTPPHFFCPSQRTAKKKLKTSTIKSAIH